MNQPKTPDNEVATTRYEIEKGVCKSKVDSMLCDPDRKVTGYFLTKENGDICMVDKGAVRWITKEEWWWIFHEADHYPKKGQLSDRDHNEVARLRSENEKLRNIADRACNLLNLKGGYLESYELRDEIKKLKEVIST